MQKYPPVDLRKTRPPWLSTDGSVEDPTTCYNFRTYIENNTDTNNPFHWNHVQFNLSCTTVYDPSLPHVRLICFDGEAVLRIIVIFDYGRVYGLGADCVKSGLSQIFQACNLLEIGNLLGKSL